MKECPACKRCFPDEINHCPQDGDATTPSLLGEPILDARYQLERRLGQGGMGVVFQARHIFLKTSHAIKVILPDLVGNDPMLVTRFRQEALAAAAIRHQNIIAVTDFGVVRGTMPFLVMEYVSGKSLQEILAEEKVMSPARALEFTCAMGAGVAAAHRQNIVHRDLKPLNIMTQQGVPIAEGLKILDFGLAKIKSGELLGSFVQAKTSGLMGSPFYMAPEQWSDEEPDVRADVYSLAIILYQMLAGDVPFKGSSIPSIMKKHLTLPPPTFKSMGVDIAPRIESVVRHALEKELENRIPTVELFLRELREAVEASGATAHITQQTGPIDVSDTIFSPAATTDKEPETVISDAGVGLMPGAVAGLKDQQKIEAAREAYEREQKEKERIAREELEREAEARRKAQEEEARRLAAEQARKREEERQREEDEHKRQEEARKLADEESRRRAEEQRRRKEEEERLKKEREEREARERQQREQIERVERQAKELEDRLARLVTSIPPQTAVVDLDSTQVHPQVQTEVIGNNSFPGASAPLPTTPSPPFRTTISTEAPKSKSLLIIGAGLLVVLLLSGLIAAYFLLRTRTATPGGNGPGINQRPPEPAVKADLVEIPGGTFLMGRNNGPPQERPEHSATVQKFLMDRTEVTNAEYADFVRDMNYEPPGHWVNGKPLAGQERWPVVNVSAKDAEAFAAWRSKRDGVVYRLPTEEEWEFAARNGSDRQSYPWGNAWQENRAVVKEAAPRPIGTYPDGANRWGVVDLIGNAWEWTSSKASIYDRSIEIPAANKNWQITRGGSYASDPGDRQIPVSSTYRDWFDPTMRHPNFGFRLVRSTQ